MSDTLSPNKIQVLYEISLSIQAGTDLEATVESAISSYVQKLNCSGVAVFERTETASGETVHDLLTAVPERAATDGTILDVATHLSEDPATQLPRIDELQDDTYRYTMGLPEFGVLVLLKRGQQLDDDILALLPEVNEKLATACTRIVVQNQYEAQYRELFEEAPVMFLLTEDRNGELFVADCNEEFVDTLGYDREEINGRRLGYFYTDKCERQLLSSGYDRAMHGEFGTEKRVLETQQGEEITTTLRATPRRNRNGEVVGTNCIYVNVTTLKRRNQQLSVLHRLLRHNLRNELTVIKGHLEAARNHAEDGTLESIGQASDSLEALEVTARRASRAQAVLGESEISSQDIEGIVASIAARAREKFPEATVTTTVDSAPVHATDSLEHALWELVENACVHAGVQPTVAITVRGGPETTTVEIADDGPGIPESEREIIGIDEETQLRHGSGLGLWLVRWVLERSGGDICFNRDNGTVVTVTLPRPDS